MSANLKDRGQFFRFFGVSLIGTVADYLAALGLEQFLSFSFVVASTWGFVVGSIINYAGHNLISYAHTDARTISVRGYVKYFMAVVLSLVVRLAVVAALGFVTALPFWFILLCAIGASFLTSYAISTLWVFKKSEVD
ncbi:MAG: GtrA family protein [Paracoccaceae bacterium]